MVCVTPLLTILMVAVRATPVMLGCVEIENVPFPMPVDGVMVTHDWSQPATHVPVVVIVTGAGVEEPLPMVTVLVETTSGDDDDCCVTVTVWLATPVPEIVTVAVRPTVVLSADVKVIIPLPEPVLGFTVSQVWFDDAVHEVFDVTFTVTVLPATPAMLTLLEESESTGVVDLLASCVTAMVRVMPSLVTVMVAVRLCPVVLGVAEMYKLPIPFPVNGLMISHCWSLATDHAELDETLTEVVLPNESMFKTLVESTSPDCSSILNSFHPVAFI